MRADLEDARQGLGRVPQGRPPLLGPGERYWRLYQAHAEAIAEALRTERAAELAAAAAPPPPAAPEPPAWLFGPRHRELDAQRRAAAEAARHAPDAPPATSLPKLCPCCLQPLPGGVL